MSEQSIVAEPCTDAIHIVAKKPKKRRIRRRNIVRRTRKIAATKIQSLYRGYLTRKFSGGSNRNDRKSTPDLKVTEESVVDGPSDFTTTFNTSTKHIPSKTIMGRESIVDGPSDITTTSNTSTKHILSKTIMGRESIVDGFVSSSKTIDTDVMIGVSSKPKSKCTRGKSSIRNSESKSKTHNKFTTTVFTKVPGTNLTK